MSLTYTPALKIDWSNDGDFVDAGEDVTARVLGASVRRGRANVTDEYGPGEMRFSLRNDSGDYSPFYAAGPLYGNLVPGRRCKLEITVGVTTYPVYYGYLQSIAQGRSHGGPPTVEFTAMDAFDILRYGLTNTPLQEGKRVDELLDVILDDVSWAAGDRDLDTGPETLTVFTNHNRLPVNALQLAAGQDPGSRLFMGKDNKVVYRTRRWASGQASAATFDGVQSLAVDIRRDDLFDAVRASYPRFGVSATLSDVFTLAFARRLPPGATTFDFEIGGFGATGYVVPVATTDFMANAQADGGGADKTAQVSFIIDSSHSGGGTVTVTNADSADVWLTELRVRAYAVEVGEESNVLREDIASPLVTRQTLSRAFEFQDAESVAAGWVRWQKHTRGAIQPRPVIDVLPATNAELVSLLGLDLGSRVTLTNTAGPYPTEIAQDFVVEAIEWDWAPGGAVRCRLSLWHRDLAIASMFRISGATLYSQIAPAGATAGYDRIGW